MCVCVCARGRVCKRAVMQSVGVGNRRLVTLLADAIIYSHPVWGAAPPLLRVPVEGAGRHVLPGDS